MDVEGRTVYCPCGDHDGSGERDQIGARPVSFDDDMCDHPLS